MIVSLSGMQEAAGLPAHNTKLGQHLFAEHGHVGSGRGHA
jgi:hypothetical protein